MFEHSKYYIAESGLLLDAAEKFREECLLWRKEYTKFFGEHGAVGGQVDFNGKLFTLKFKGEAPKGFKKPNKYGCQAPYVKNKEWIEKLNSVSAEPKAIDFIAEKMEIITHIKYEKGESKGCMSVGHPIVPVSICFYSADSPLLIILPDVEKAVSDKEADGYTITSQKHHKLPEGLREIIKEEWDFMVAKFKKDNAER